MSCAYVSGAGVYSDGFANRGVSCGVAGGRRGIVPGSGAPASLIDGIVGDYGLLPNDDDAHLEGPFLKASVDRHEVAGVAVFLTLTFTEVQS